MREAGHAERGGVDGDHLQALALALEGDGLGIAGGAHPLDGDRAAAGADIPEQRAGIGRELGERRGADLALGQLAIVDEGVVGQAGDRWQQRRAGIGDAIDGEDVEIADVASVEVLGRRRGDAFVGAAEIFERR